MAAPNGSNDRANRKPSVLRPVPETIMELGHLNHNSENDHLLDHPWHSTLQVAFCKGNIAVYICIQFDRNLGKGEQNMITYF